MIQPLPDWVIPDTDPAFYDSESLTAIQMVAKIYGKMNELVKSYNEFLEEDRTLIEDAIKYMKDNIVETATTLFNNAMENGEIYVSLGTNYDEDTKELVLNIEALPSETVLNRLSQLATPEESV